MYLHPPASHHPKLISIARVDLLAASTDDRQSTSSSSYLTKGLELFITVPSGSSFF
uniref:Uncharacterized protein n=1 Tax=Setaria italica TaxID=4555 RepID=K3YXM2_SETIT